MGYTPHVIVVGGGVLGTAIARDFAIRGLEVTLVEQGRLSTGTTGRMQGVLYSGAQFVDGNPSGARWCQRESYVLRRIADHCIEETGGVILPSPDEDVSEFVGTCEKYDLSVSELSGDGLAKELPAAPERFDGGVRTPDAVVDPFRLTRANAAGAREYDAELKTGAKVVDLIEENGQVTGVEVEYVSTTEVGREPTEAAETARSVGPDADETGENGDEASGDEGSEEEDSEGEGSGDENEEGDEKGMPGEIQRSFPGASADDEPEAGERDAIEGDFVVNVTGAWADRIAALAGIGLPLSRTRGMMLVLEGQRTESIVTLRTGSGEIAVTPYQGNTVVGPVELSGTDDPVDRLLAEAKSILPDIGDVPILRSYSGVWTQHASSEGPPSGPGVTLIDHKKYDDKWGMLSVVGGTVTTHRLIAEKVVDRVCSEFGIDRECLTDEIPLPESPGETATGSDSRRLGSAKSITGAEGDASGPDPVLCESRSVTRESVRSVLRNTEEETDLSQVRIQTGATMGACQGGRCGHRIAAELYNVHEPGTVEDSLEQLLETRWRGRREVLRGEQLASALRDYELHASVLGRDQPTERGVTLDPFDQGADHTVRLERSHEPDQSLFEHAPELEIVCQVPETESGRPMYSEAVIR